MKKKAIRILSVWLCLLMLVVPVVRAETTEDKLKDTASEIEDLEDKKDEKEDLLNGLEDLKKTLKSDLRELDGQLEEISQKLDDLQQQVDEKNELIAEKELEVQAMQETCEEQYENMKKRIRYTYENSQESILDLLFDSKSFSDFLNRAEYALAIQNYDRQMLESYEQTVTDLSAERESLKEEKIELAAIQEEMKEKQGEVNTLIAKKQTNISTTNSQIGETQSDIDDYNAQIEKQKEYEKKLEVQKAKEDAAKLAEIKKQEAAENLSNVVVVPEEGDEALLAALIECEAGGESYEGKLAVGSVVMNRVASSYFPNTVVGVIYQSGQFSPVASGRFATVLARGAASSCVQAAQEILGGKRTVSVLYFRVDNGLIDGIVIGNHVFY